MTTRVGERPPPPTGDDLTLWAEDLVDFLVRNESKLGYLEDLASSAEDGEILYSPNGYPVFSTGNAWRELVVNGGYADISRVSAATAGATNTAQTVAWDSTPTLLRISVVSSTQVTYEEGGLWRCAYTAQFVSSSASTAQIYTWLAVNGVDVPNSMVRTSISGSGQTRAVSNAQQLDLNDGDYVELKWAVSNTNVTLNYQAATAFGPATPAATFSTSRVSQRI